MRKVVRAFSGVVCLVLTTGVPYAAALTSLDGVTKTCQDRIASKGAKFVAARYGALAKCVKAALACKTEESPADQRACLGKLLVPAKGACAEGKLDSGNATIGVGAAQSALNGGKAGLDAALAALVGNVDGACFSAPADLSSVAGGLGFPASITSARELADHLNRVPGGLGCIALAQLVDAVPRVQEVVDELRTLDHTCLKAGSGGTPSAACATDADCGAGGVCGRLAFALNQATITCCPIGTERLDGTCQRCAPGSFSDETTGSVCLACDAGHFTPIAGQTECVACSAGHFTAATGATTCDSCEPGTFASEPGSTVCTSCTAGTSSPAEAVGCTSCPSGTFSSPGSSSCTACQAGYFAATPGQSECQSCPAGRYSALGSSSCTPCDPGTFSGHAASASCSPCPPSTVAPAPESTQCTACPAHATPNAQRTQCLCDVGYFATTVDGALVCAECPQGVDCGEPGLP